MRAIAALVCFLVVLNVGIDLVDAFRGKATADQIVSLIVYIPILVLAFAAARCGELGCSSDLDGMGDDQ